MTKRIKPKGIAIQLAEALAVAHFLVANAVILIGEFTSMLQEFGSTHAGVHFVFTYLDPFIGALYSATLTSASDRLVYYLLCELVVVISSVIYAALCYFAVRFIFLLNRP